MSDLTLVVGATGHLGAQVCRRLRDRGERVRALVRVTSDPGKVDALRALGVEIVRGDLRHDASLEQACEGVRAVVSTATMIACGREGDSLDTVDQRGVLSLLSAAREAGVDHFVFVSVDTDSVPASPFQQAKSLVQDALRASTMAYTIIQPSLFMESWLGPVIDLDLAAGRAKVLGDGDRKISYISAADVAEFVVHVLADPLARNLTLRVGGQARTQVEAIRAFEEAVGRPFVVDRIPESAIEQQWQTATDPLEKSFASLMLSAARGHEVPMDGVLARFPVQLTSVEDYARRVAGQV